MVTTVSPPINNIIPLGYNVIEDVKTSPASPRKSEFNTQLKDVSANDKKPSHAKFFIKNTMLVTLRACTILRSLITTKHIRENSPERADNLIKNKANNSPVTVFRHNSPLESKSSVIPDNSFKNEKNTSPTTGIDVNGVKAIQGAESEKPAMVTDAPLSQATEKMPLSPVPSSAPTEIATSLKEAVEPEPAAEEEEPQTPAMEKMPLPPVPSSAPTEVATSLKETVESEAPVEKEERQETAVHKMPPPPPPLPASAPTGIAESLKITVKPAAERYWLKGPDQGDLTKKLAEMKAAGSARNFVSKATEDIAKATKKEAEAMANLSKTQERQAWEIDNIEKLNAQKIQNQQQEAKAKAAAIAAREAELIAQTPKDARGIPVPPPPPTAANTPSYIRATINGPSKSKVMNEIIDQLKGGNFKLNKTVVNEHKTEKSDENRGKLDFSAMMVKRIRPQANTND